MDYPQKIKVSGLPFMLQGWNNIFTKTDSDEPVYRLNEYTLYGLIPIAPAIIYKLKDRWILRREDDFLGHWIPAEGTRLTGRWSGGVKVVEYFD
jgi:hypothetical protein